MLFAHDTQVGLQAAAALVNTDSREGDGLETPGELEAFVRRWGWTGSREGTPGELDRVRSLRPRLRRIWTADVSDAVAGINDLLAQARALPQLVRHDGWDWHLHATAPEAPLDTRMAVEAAMAMVDVVRSGQWERMRVCAGADCDRVLVDLSKNRSRRYCDGGCGNRAHVAAYRARRSTGS